MDRRRLAVFLCGAAAFVPLYAPQSLLPLLRLFVGHNAAMAGAIVSAGTAGVALAAPFMGRLGDRLGRRNVITLAAFLAALPSLLSALAPTPALLIAARLLEGLALPGIFAVTVAYTADQWPPAEARPVTALYVAGTIFGGFCGRLVSGLIAEFSGWRLAFFGLAVLQLLLAVLIRAWLAPDRVQPRANGAARVPFTAPLSHPGLRAMYATGFMMLFALVAGFTYVSLRLADAPFLLGPGALSAIFVVYLVGALTTPVSGRLLNRYGHGAVLTGAWIAAITGLLITLLPSLALTIVGLALFSAGIFFAQTAATTFVGEAMPAARGAAVGLYVTSYYLGGSVGGVLPAPLWTHFGWAGVVALICTAGMMSMLVGRYGLRRPAPSRG
ncbi:MFS transporter [Solimonas marina]|uniref:MFS transporter n=1 Tax=Solimonas marina TaxID=2714601 RepID=A0A969W889_9GAMM|nr:MFS transporter [Solimonas marina]NKF22442.1 MFS transporter [Solimonas marina]